MISQSDQFSLGQAAVRSAPLFNLDSSMVLGIVVWGFGFDERDGERKRELPTQHALRLYQYWSGFFGEITSRRVSIHFEMPR